MILSSDEITEWKNDEIKFTYSPETLATARAFAAANVGRFTYVLWVVKTNDERLGVTDSVGVDDTDLLARSGLSG